MNSGIGNWRKATYSNGQGACVEVGTWRKPTHSNGSGACVEVGTWRKATSSNGQGACVEVGTHPAHVAVRDTKDRAAAPLTFSPTTWQAFTRTLRAT